MNIEELKRLIDEYLETLSDDSGWFETFTSYRSIAYDVLVEDWNDNCPSFLKWMESRNQ